MRLNRLLYTASALLIRHSASAFISPFKQSKVHTSGIHHSTTKTHHSTYKHTVLSIRGGDIKSNIMSTTALPMHLGPVLKEALVSGTPLRAVGALYAIASLVVVPLTWYRTAYSFSVGYGLSVAATALALLSSFTFTGGGVNLSIAGLQSLSTPSILALTALVYGLRLGLYILVRERTVESKKKQFEDMNKTPVLKRTPLALGVSLLYAFMVSPVLFALRTTVESGSKLELVQKFFTGVAAFGTVLEAVADAHKYEVKRKSKDGEDKFVGPTTWSYRLCRHPNYYGEILHWVGLFGAGCVVFGKDIVAWVSGLLGLWGILAIMLGASKGLDKKQEKKYSGQPAYDEWKEKVTSSVIPFLR